VGGRLAVADRRLSMLKEEVAV